METKRELPDALYRSLSGLESASWKQCGKSGNPSGYVELGRDSIGEINNDNINNNKDNDNNVM